MSAFFDLGNSIKYRKIIHIDMDAFYASVAQYDNPDLKGKPVAVGGGGDRGVIAAASYEARKFGVRSAMSSKQAKKLCPDLIFVKSHFSRYKEISNQVRKIFHEYTDLVEPLSLDEAFLDVTKNKKNNPSATLIAKEIREAIFKKTGLTASAGISINKFLAKIASDENKPNGQCLIPPEEVNSFLENLRIERFFGIGKVTANKMKKMGIFTGKDLKKWSLEDLEKHFKTSGVHFYRIVRGIHQSPVKPFRERKSLSAERTFSKDIIDITILDEELFEICREVNQRLKKGNHKGKTITLKIKYKDFTVSTRSKTFDFYFNDFKIIYSEVKELMLANFSKKFIRLLGVGVSNFEKEEMEEFKPYQIEIPFKGFYK